MPHHPRRSSRLKLKEAAAKAAEEERYSRQKKRREIRCVPPSSLNDVHSTVCGVWSDNSKLQLEATSHLLNLVSLEDNPLTDEVVEYEVVHRLVEFLSRNDYPELQCEAACVLKTMAAGTSENTKIVVDSGAVPVFVKLLQSSELYEQAAWALGNIAGDCHGCRDVVLNNGALQPLLTLLKEHTDFSFLRIGTWALSNFLEGKPEIPPEQLESAIPILSSVILTEDDELVLKEACWALFYLSQFGGGIETIMFEAGLCDKITTIFRYVYFYSVFFFRVCCLMLLIHVLSLSLDLSIYLFRYVPSTVLFPAVRALKCILKGAKKLDERAIEVHLRLIRVYRKDSTSCILNEAHDIRCFLDDRMSSIVNGVKDDYRKKARLAQDV
ncbi:Importin subunit alpha-2 [Striga hermonthica]|uniref:Importin subunit alpha-2 n=1 Tax=Striga hermonthica TaxID=68872 RepID=A0A9N7RA07_STRHE|nr:Importin subunit alpha-2 [Striga hermonthica]